MDPDANLEEQLELANRLVDLVDEVHTSTVDVVRLAELVLAMDEWIGRGGFVPKRWSRRQA